MPAMACGSNGSSRYLRTAAGVRPIIRSYSSGSRPSIALDSCRSRRAVCTEASPSPASCAVVASTYSARSATSSAVPRAAPLPRRRRQRVPGRTPAPAPAAVEAHGESLRPGTPPSNAPLSTSKGASDVSRRAPTSSARNGRNRQGSRAARRVEDVLVPLLRVARTAGRALSVVRDEQGRVEERLPVVRGRSRCRSPDGSRPAVAPVSTRSGRTWMTVAGRAPRVERRRLVRLLGGGVEHRGDAARRAAAG